MKVISKAGEPEPLPGFSTNRPAQLGPYVVKISVLNIGEHISMMIAYWKGHAQSYYWLLEAPHTCKIAYFTDVEVAQKFIVALADGVDSIVTRK